MTSLEVAGGSTDRATNTADVIADDAEAIEVARAMRERLAAGSAERDRDRRLPFAEMDALSTSGLLAITVPKEHGGAGVSTRTLVEVIALLSSGDASVGQIPQNHFYFVGILKEQASPEQQRHFFAELLAGRRFGNAIAERRTAAVNQYDIRFTRVRDGWLLDGSKYYCTGTPFADWIPTYADDEQGRLHAAFVPADSPGVRIHDDWPGMGQRVTGSGTVRFSQVQVPDEFVVPVYPLFERTEVFGAFGNVLHAAIDAGIADASLRDAKHLIRTLARPWWEAEVARASAEPGVIDRFGELALEVRAANALLYQAAERIDEAYRDLTAQTSAEASAAVAAARAGADRAALRVSSEMFELIGTRAASDDLNLHRHWRNARTHTLHDPRRWKVHHLGNYELNDVAPPPNRIG
jgi:SfnB family sulfur acquisition oxidoreductase